MPPVGQNFPNPIDLANEIVQNVKNSAENVVKSCRAFSMAWENYEAEFWSETQMAKFLNKLKDSGIGSGATDLYSQKDGTYKITSKNATLSMLKGIGDSELFRNKSAVNACRVVGYSVLYQLTLYYTASLDKAERTKKGDPAKIALNDTLTLMDTFGASLRRDDVIEAKSKLLPKKQGAAKRKDHGSPSTSSTSTLDSLTADKKTYASLLVTADEKLTELARDSSLLDLRERLDYDHLLEPGAKMVVTGRGSELSEILKIATCLGINQPKVYLSGEESKDSSLVDLSGLTLLLTNADLSKGNFDKKRSLAQNLRSVAAFEGGLNLFADREEDGWVSVLGFEDSLNG